MITHQQFFFFNQKINNKFFHVQNQFCISERTDCTIVVETENSISILDFFFSFFLLEIASRRLSYEVSNNARA